MREIKFRAWDDTAKTILLWEELLDAEHFNKVFTDPSYYGITSVMQYTGLKDKNGVEIYEGDVLLRYSRNSPVPDKRAIYWNQQAAQFQLTDLANPINYFQSIEVVGNIHQNPELLK